jgi:hypothetical protein
LTCESSFPEILDDGRHGQGGIKGGTVGKTHLSKTCQVRRMAWKLGGREDELEDYD